MVVGAGEADRPKQTGDATGFRETETTLLRLLTTEPFSDLHTVAFLC